VRDDQGYLSNATYGTYVTYWSSLISPISYISPIGSLVPDSLRSPSPPGSWILDSGSSALTARTAATAGRMYSG